MEVCDFIARLILGLLFFIFGANGFLNRLPIPPAEPRMQKFVQSLQETNYLMTIVKVIEILSGLCLLTGFFVPLALLCLAPVIFVIVSAQLFLNGRRGWGISFLTLIPFLVLLATRWNSFEPFLRP